MGDVARSSRGAAPRRAASTPSRGRLARGGLRRAAGSVRGRRRHDRGREHHARDQSEAVNGRVMLRSCCYSFGVGGRAGGAGGAGSAGGGRHRCGDDPGGERVAVGGSITRNAPARRLAPYCSRGRSAASRSAHLADVVELEACRRARASSVSRSQRAVRSRDQGLHRAGAVLDEHRGARAERLGREPEQRGVEVATASRQGAGRRDRCRRGRRRTRRPGAATRTAGRRPRRAPAARQSMPVTVVVAMPAGEDLTWSPTRTVPDGDPAGVGAVVAVGLGLDVVGDGVRRQRALRPDAPAAPGSGSSRARLSSSSAAGSVSSSSSSAGPSYQGVRSERSTTLSPSSAETGMTCDVVGRPSSRPTRSDLRRDPARTRPREVRRRSILFTATITCGTRSSCSTAGAGGSARARPCGRRSSTTTASAVVAPVTMLRVYCTCPGQSARMNAAAAVAK